MEVNGQQLTPKVCILSNLVTLGDGFLMAVHRLIYVPLFARASLLQKSLSLFQSRSQFVTPPILKSLLFELLHALTSSTILTSYSLLVIPSFTSLTRFRYRPTGLPRNGDRTNRQPQVP